MQAHRKYLFDSFPQSFRLVKALPMVFVPAVLLFVSFDTGLARQAGGQIQIPADGSCVSSECHLQISKFTNRHAVVDDCVSCHVETGKGHSFEPVSDVAALCTQCHSELTAQPVVHPPATDDCTVCHQPHGSDAPKLLVDSNVGQLCFSCHDSEIVEKPYKHGPAAAGACTVCHDPHSAPENSLVRAPVVTLCEGCHVDMAEQLAAASDVHDPVTSDCTLCHDPHSGPEPRMIASNGRRLCETCHVSLARAADQAAVKHSPVEGPDGCPRCHQPHASNAAPLLKQSEMDLCLSCHNRPLPEASPELVDMKDLLARNQNWHGPITEGSCVGCHEVHGGEHFRLLVDSYPARFYSAFATENYALCFECHEEAAITEQYTTSLTGFRDGDLNLHYVHVRKERRGRTCRACHEVHASRQPLHLRDSVPYGSWNLPIGFQKNENGGSCSPGCHEPLPYNRDSKPQRTAR